MKNKKILVFCPYYPPHIGGLECHAEEFNKKLVSRGWTITVLTPDLPVSSELGSEGRLKIYRYPAWEAVPNFPIPKFWDKNFWWIWNEVKTGDYGIVISRTRFFLSSIWAGLFAKSKKIAWVHIEHGSDFVQLNSKITTLIAVIYDEIVGRWIFKNAEKVIPISEAVKKFTSKFGARAEKVIYRGLDFESLNQTGNTYDLKKKYKGKILIAFVGRLYKWKGVEEAVKAVKELPKDIRKKVKFLIVGYGEEEDRLKKMGGDPIVFLGQLNGKAVLKEIDIYIHPSMPGGGLSTSLLEAIYQGCAIVATRNEGADEIVDDNMGVIVGESEKNRIRDGIVEVVKKLEFYKKNVRSNRQKIISTFNWDINIKEYEKMFKEL